MDCTCVWPCLLKWAVDRRRGRDIMARKAGELLPSQGHCTEVIFIDHSTVKGTRALMCTVVDVFSSITVIGTGSFVYCGNRKG